VTALAVDTLETLRIGKKQTSGLTALRALPVELDAGRVRATQVDPRGSGEASGESSEVMSFGYIRDRVRGRHEGSRPTTETSCGGKMELVRSDKDPSLDSKLPITP
jgi:hypothetical protein